jgi:peptidyl-prolyl cis-trans isomerase C
VDALRSKAEAILRELHEEPARFPALASQYSNCPSGQQGGNLGQLARRERVPEFERVVFDTRSTGLLSDLVRTRFGFHIVAVDGRVPGQTVPYEAVSGKIAAYLRERVQRKALEQYARVLAAEVGVAVPGLMHATSPLLQ